jgi:PAS domain S-box-containing protein
MCVTNEACRFVMVNDAYCETYGYRRDELIGQVFTKVLPESDRDFAFNMHKRYLEGHPESEGEWTICRKDGELRTIWVTAARVITDNDERFKVTTVTDITDRKRGEEALEQALEDKTTLLKEVHHRVKNNLQVIGSLLYLQSHTLDDDAAKKAFNDSRLRVRAMAAVHELIYENDSLDKIDFEVYLEKLADIIVKSMKSQEIHTIVDADNISLEIDKAIPLGLICNELITNSLKYAFPEDYAGEATLGVRLERNLNRTITMTYEGNGIGLPADYDIDSSNSLGMTIIDSLTGQLSGNITFNRREGSGLRVTLVFKP